MSKLKAVIDGVQADVALEIESALREFRDDLRGDLALDYAKGLKERFEEYLVMFDQGRITAEQLRWLSEGLKGLVEAKADQVGAEARVRMLGLAASIGRIVLNGIARAIL